MLLRLITTILVLLIFQVDSYSQFQSKIAFTSIRDGNNRDIYVMKSDINNQARLTTNPSEDYQPTWSPDGNQIAFVSNRNNGKNQIWVIDSDGNNPIRITNGERDEFPDWSPNGIDIVYQSEVRKQFGQSLFEIHIIESDGGNKRKLVGENSIHPSWSSGGTRVVFSYSKDFDINQLYSIGSNGQNLEQLTSDEVYKRYPSWSPDGEKIVYVGRQHVWVMDTNGENQKQVTFDDDFSEEHPTWSPNSRYIIFESLRKDGGVGIYSVSVSGGKVKRILASNRETNFHPDWYQPNLLSVDNTYRLITTWGEIKKQ